MGKVVATEIDRVRETGTLNKAAKKNLIKLEIYLSKNGKTDNK